MFRADLDRAGVPAVVNGEEAVFHSLRHSFATLVAEVATVKTAQELVRHSDPNLTIGRYSHTTAAAKAEAVGRMNLPGTAKEKKSARQPDPCRPGNPRRVPGGCRVRSGCTLGCTPGCTRLAFFWGWHWTDGDR